jgi:hypothetical protein
MAFNIPSIQFFFGLPRAFFVLACTSMLFAEVFLLPFFGHGRTTHFNVRY